MRKRFEALAGQVLQGSWEEDPVEATYLGIHAYDGVLARTDPGSRRAYHEQRSGFLRELREFDLRRGELDPLQRLDLDLLVGELEASLLADEQFRLHERRADRYPSEALHGIYLLAMRRFAPLEQRLLSIRDRLRDTPRSLSDGIDNLRAGDNIPAVWTENGIVITRNGTAFLESLIPELAGRAGGAIGRELQAAAAAACEAMRRFERFLREDLLPMSTGGFAIGREAFDQLLRTRHHLPYDSRRLEEIGREMIERTQSALELQAGRIDPGATWIELVDLLKRDHPAPENLLATYRAEMERARSFVAERGLATIPEGQELHVVETPPFERHTLPYAALVPAAPFEEKQESYFWVTPVSEGATAEEAEQQLQGHCSWGVPVTALHEGFPGHHLQLTLANRVESPVRRQLATSVFIEGWALYCEEMMEEVGFISDPRSVLFRLKDQLWRACRVVIDVGLHCGGMGFEGAVEMLASVAKLERKNAVAEVRRYTTTPTQSMSYLIGKQQILELRKDVAASRGGEFGLRDFHDRLLSFGSIPVAKIREQILGTGA